MRIRSRKKSEFLSHERNHYLTITHGFNRDKRKYKENITGCLLTEPRFWALRFAACTQTSRKKKRQQLKVTCELPDAPNCSFDYENLFCMSNEIDHVFRRCALNKNIKNWHILADNNTCVEWRWTLFPKKLDDKADWWSINQSIGLWNGMAGNVKRQWPGPAQPKQKYKPEMLTLINFYQVHQGWWSSKKQVGGLKVRYLPMHIASSLIAHLKIDPIT